MRYNHRKQSGVALLMAILIVVAATAVSVALIHDEAFLIRKTARVQLLDRARVYALGLEDWGRLILRRDRLDNAIDHLKEDWATEDGVGIIPIEAGYMRGSFEDEQAKFNINSLLVDSISEVRFRRLCVKLDIDPDITPAIIDWIDTNQTITGPGGIEFYDDYRAANRDMVDATELLLVEGVTYKIYNVLKDFVTALPPAATINVNTMSGEVFRSLDNSLDDSDVTNFLSEREKDPPEPFTSVDNMVTRLKVAIDDTTGLSVTTEYFRANGEVLQGDLYYNFKTLIHRDTSGNTKIDHRSLSQF